MNSSIEQINELPIPTDMLVEKIRKKIAEYKSGPFDTFYGTPPYIQWNNMSLKGDTWLIEKSQKGTDTASTGRSSGVITVKIIAGHDKTVLKAYIKTDEDIHQIGRYFGGVIVVIAFIAFVMADFNWYSLAVGLGIALIMILAPMLRENQLPNLRKYYHLVLKEVIK